MNTKNQSGQVIIILLLIMVVGLAIGLSVVGRSVSEISTATKVESSARAFAAAEAGLEKIIREASVDLNFDENQAKVVAEKAVNLPVSNVALEYDSVHRESFAQFWLANPVNLNRSYSRPNFDIYFGKNDIDYTDNLAEQPAIEIHVISKKVTPGGEISYTSKRFFVDSYSGREPDNGFEDCDTLSPSPIRTNKGDVDKNFYCKRNINIAPTNDNDYPILVRVRLLYSQDSHPIALAPTRPGGSLPAQAAIYQSIGSAGETQRKLQIFEEQKVMPFFFDYALFSAGDVEKL